MGQTSDYFIRCYKFLNFSFNFSKFWPFLSMVHFFNTSKFQLSAPIAQNSDHFFNGSKFLQQNSKFFFQLSKILTISLNGPKFGPLASKLQNSDNFCLCYKILTSCFNGSRLWPYFQCLKIPTICSHRSNFWPFTPRHLMSLLKEVCCHNLT